jgi:pyruvate dehydrogenase E2 component (dihydrolipoamide acetyltransferase)
MTDKVVADLEAPASGILKGVRAGAQDGDTVPVGETFAFIAGADEQVPVLPPLATGKSANLQISKEQSDLAQAPVLPPVAEESGPALKDAEPVRASPVVRRIAKELGADLTEVKGTGPGGRIQEEDVRAFAEAATHRVPAGQASTPAPQPPALAEEPGALLKDAEPILKDAEPVRASPVARRMARELDVDLAQVKGTGPGGRIREEDIRAFAEAQRTATSEEAASAQRNRYDATPAPPQVRATLDATTLDLSPFQRVTGQRMLESVQTAPQFALTIQVDMTNALWLREALMARSVAETGERLSVTAMLVKIVAVALKSYPRANASFENGRVKLHPQVNVGVAVGTEGGLVVPVVKEADGKSLIQITQELKVFQEKAEHMRFTSEDLAEGTFTISNLGMYGIDRFNAILNPPQSAILAVGRVIKTPVAMPDDTIALRPMMSLTLTVDHRSMDGIQGASFLAEVKERIEKPYFLL